MFALRSRDIATGAPAARSRCSALHVWFRDVVARILR
jgi:hypothetical protein